MEKCGFCNGIGSRICPDGTDGSCDNCNGEKDKDKWESTIWEKSLPKNWDSMTEEEKDSYFPF